MIKGICDTYTAFVWAELPHGKLPEFGDTVSYAGKTYKVVSRDFQEDDIILTLKPV